MKEGKAVENIIADNMLECTLANVVGVGRLSLPGGSVGGNHRALLVVLDIHFQ